jgi:cell division protein FtsA
MNEVVPVDLDTDESCTSTEEIKDKSTETQIRRSFFDKYVDKIKDFLDNAE